MSGHDVGYWHEADIAAQPLDVRFGGKADMPRRATSSFWN